MTKLESDLLIFGMLFDFTKDSRLKVSEMIPEYEENKNKIYDLLINQPMSQSEDEMDKAMTKLANQVYSRIIKKTT